MHEAIKLDQTPTGSQTMTDALPAGMPAYFTSRLIRNARMVTLKKGERLFLTGDRVEGIYYVLDGEIKAIRPLLKEGDAVMVRSRAGEYFAETAMAIESYVCDAYCTKDTHLVFLVKSEILEALKDTGFALGFALALAANSRRQCSRYERLRLHRSEDRLLHYLACESDTSGRLAWSSTLAELAAELAIEPETLYRVIASLEKQGKITRNGKIMELHGESPR